jgi:response regulator RpfG family c-di-GMP phosphodiesterase
MAVKILCVDDDPNVLEAYRRLLRKSFTLSVATHGEQGLKAVMDEGPFAVIISDMHMPGMSGTQFFQKVSQVAPYSVRIMLTGATELNVAMEALNEGHIFRFLTKPIDFPTLLKAIAAAIIQYRLVTSEQELLEQTLTGSIKVLIGVLEIMSPLIVARTLRIKYYVVQLARLLNMEPLWQFEIAAMLSQIGCITLPGELLKKMGLSEAFTPEEKHMLKNFPGIGSRLISPVPRMEKVASMIASQQKAFNDFHDTRDTPQDPVATGAQLLRICIDYDSHLSRGLPQAEAIDRIFRCPDRTYNPAMMLRLQDLMIPKYTDRAKEVTVLELQNGMIMAENLVSSKGTLLVLKGTELNEFHIARLHNLLAKESVITSCMITMPSEGHVVGTDSRVNNSV